MNAANRFLIIVGLVALPLLAACSPQARVGALRTESQSVELDDSESVRVEINFGAGELDLTGGAAKLLEADFTYNVAMLRPEVAYTDGTLVVRQPETRGLPDLRNITDFRNEWDLRFFDEMPMSLKVNVGGGISNLRLAGLSLTRLDLNLGAGSSTVDLGGDWARDLDVTLDTGAADSTVILPRDAGVRVEVDAGPTKIDARGLTQAGNVYTNAAYGVSEVTVHVTVEAGIGWLNLEVEE